jgi:hypothetical protein
MARRYRLWKARRRKVERCETCGRDLRRNQTVELASEPAPGKFGWTATVATYCKRHAPRKAQS